jgi:hypothetical protein
MKLHVADNLTIDLLKLIDSRMLIQANSGGGKSWLLRLIAEQAAGHVQIVILDPEGEFATLRQRFDFLLAGQSGDLPAESRSAGLLARKLLELQASAIVDLYDLKMPDRRRFVRLFLESLMSLPKALWHPLLIMIDEAHLFCPERSAGDAESTQAVIDLMSQGRKRSYCGILSTQRLSKLHKDAEAETNNVFIGRTWLDIDQQRAGGLLGFDKEKRGELRDLDYEFFAFGPALSVNGVVKFKPGMVQTTHPKAGQRHTLNPPKPSDAVKRIVDSLKDLPQQAEAEIKDLEAAKKRIAELQRELKARPVEQTPIEVEKIVEIPVLKNGQLDRAHKLTERWNGLLADAREVFGPLADAIGKATNQPARPKPAVAIQNKATVRPAERPQVAPTVSDGRLPIGEEKTLAACIQFPAGLERRQLTVMTAYKRSSRDAYISRLREKGLVYTVGDRVFASPAGTAALPNFQPLPTGEALQAYWLRILPQGERVILETLISVYPEDMARSDLDTCTSYQRSSRDAYLSRLAAKELVIDTERGRVRASDNLFHDPR